MDYTQFSQTLPTFARPFLERQGHWLGLFRTSQLVLPFPPEKGYLPQRVLSQIDCSERQPLFEGGLAQGSEIKVLSSKRRDNQSWLNVCFLSWDYCNHKAAVWQHLKCAKINSSKIRSNYFKISVTSDHCIAPYYKENTYVSSSPPVVGRLLRGSHPSSYSSPWVTEWVVCYFWILLVVVFVIVLVIIFLIVVVFVVTITVVIVIVTVGCFCAHLFQSSTGLDVPNVFRGAAGSWLL